MDKSVVSPFYALQCTIMTTSYYIQ